MRQKGSSIGTLSRTPAVKGDRLTATLGGGLGAERSNRDEMRLA